MTVSMKNDFARNPASENNPTVTPYTKNVTMTTMKSTTIRAVPIETFVYFFNTKAIISDPPLDASMLKKIAEQMQLQVKAY